MPTTYTSNAKLRKPALADADWHVPINENADLLEAVAPISALMVSPAEVPSTSLNVRVSAGKYRKPDGTIGTYAGTASQAIASGSTRVVYLDDSGTLTVAASYPSAQHVRLATVVTTGTIASITDDRITLPMTTGAAAPNVPAETAGGTYGATEQAMLQAVYDAFRTSVLGA